MRAVVTMVAFIAGLASNAFPLDVTQCGTDVPRGVVADLQNDLDCTNVGGHCAKDAAVECADDTGCDPGDSCVKYGVRLEDRATLRLNGHTISGGGAVPTATGVFCHAKNCVVEGGGGSVTNFRYGIWHWGHALMTVHDVQINDTQEAIVTAFFARRLIVDTVNVQNSVGIFATDVVATDLTLQNSGWGCGIGGAELYGRKISGTNITASYVDASRGLNVNGLTVVADCGWGVVVRDGRFQLSDSSVTGASQFDIVSRRLPLVKNVVCGTSRQYDRVTQQPTAETWAICTND